MPIPGPSHCDACHAPWVVGGRLGINLCGQLAGFLTSTTLAMWPGRALHRTSDFPAGAPSYLLGRSELLYRAAGFPVVAVASRLLKFGK